MTKGEANMLETDVIIFPMKFNDSIQELNQISETVEQETVEKQSIKTDIKHRFARLKKSLRKRSAGIL